MAKKFLMTAEEVMDELGVSRAFAYKLMQINFDKQTIRINKSYQRIDCEDVITDPKTPRSNLSSG